MHDLQNDDHRFEDRELFYRFFIDEDKKFKAMWRGNPKGRWRFQPHTIANSSIVSLPIGEGVLLAWIRADHAAFVRYVHAMRAEARQRSLDTAGWRISKCVQRSCPMCHGVVLSI